MHNETNKLDGHTFTRGLSSEPSNYYVIAKVTVKIVSLAQF